MAMLPIVIRKATKEDKTDKKYVAITGRRRVTVAKAVGKSVIKARFPGETQVIEVPLDEIELRI